MIQGFGEVQAWAIIRVLAVCSQAIVLPCITFPHSVHSTARPPIRVSARSMQRTAGAALVFFSLPLIRFCPTHERGRTGTTGFRPGGGGGETACQAAAALSSRAAQ